MSLSHPDEESDDHEERIARFIEEDFELLDALHE
jgi:hypothetical protein